MRPIDLHTHTLHSHGRDTVEDMLKSAKEKNVQVLGFTEHDPRPGDFKYPSDYQERLYRQFPIYVQEVKEIIEQDTSGVEILLGVEFDYFPGHEPRILNEKQAYNFDFALGSVHFLDAWGFDFTAKDWRGRSFEELGAQYERYFYLVEQMAASGLFDIAAHLDLVKLFSVSDFAAWIQTDGAQTLVNRALQAMGDTGMALEVSSAGLRKPCKEIYPCQSIMKLAAKQKLPIAFASDAHNVGHVAYGFAELVDYVKQFDFSQYVSAKERTLILKSF